MRELGFTRPWPKLSRPHWSTYRFPRRDKDWYETETVRVVLNPRSPKRRVLGTAIIYLKQPTLVGEITYDDAVADGFFNLADMIIFLGNPYKNATINKLSLIWQKEPPKL
jgi:hypothetical protein